MVVVKPYVKVALVVLMHVLVVRHLVVLVVRIAVDVPEDVKVVLGVREHVRVDAMRLVHHHVQLLVQQLVMVLVHPNVLVRQRPQYKI